VRKVYRIDGFLVRTYDEIEDGAIYVATSGEALKKVAYQTNTEEGDIAEALSRLKSAKDNAASEVRSKIRQDSFYKKTVLLIH
jgi:hypothetical protein